MRAFIRYHYISCRRYGYAAAHVWKVRRQHFWQTIFSKVNRLKLGHFTEYNCLTYITRKSIKFCTIWYQDLTYRTYSKHATGQKAYKYLFCQAVFFFDKLSNIGIGILGGWQQLTKTEITWKPIKNNFCAVCLSSTGTGKATELKNLMILTTRQRKLPLQTFKSE